MQRFFFPHQVHESHPSAVAAVFGRQVATDGGVVGLPFEGPFTVTNGDASVTFEPFEQASGSAPLGHWRILEKLATVRDERDRWSSRLPPAPAGAEEDPLRPHLIGTASYDADGQLRRVRALVAELETLFGMQPDEQQLPHVIRRAAEFALGRYGLTRKHALVKDIVMTLLPLGASDEQIADLFAEVAERGHTSFPFDERGIELDAIAAEQDRRREEEARAKREVRLVQSVPNDRTLAEENAIGFAIDKAVVGVRAAPLPLLGVVLNSEFTKQPIPQDDKRYYPAFSRVCLLGAKVEPGAILPGVEVLPDDFVRPGTREEVRASVVAEPTPDLRRYVLDTLRASGARTPVDGQHDESSAEGRARLEQWRATVDTTSYVRTIAAHHRCPTTGNPMYPLAWDLLLSSGRDGFELALDLVAADLETKFAEVWTELHEPDRIAHENRERSRAEDAKAGRYQVVKRIFGGVKLEKNFTGMQNGKLTVEKEEWKPTPWRCPPLPPAMTEAKILERLKATPALFDPGELFVRDEGAITQIAAVMGTDPFKPQIAALVEGRDDITSPEIEETLGTSTPQARARIARILNGLGFVKKRVRREGVDSWRYVRETSANDVGGDAA